MSARKVCREQGNVIEASRLCVWNPVPHLNFSVTISRKLIGGAGLSLPPHNFTHGGRSGVKTLRCPCDAKCAFPHSNCLATVHASTFEAVAKLGVAPAFDINRWPAPPRSGISGTRGGPRRLRSEAWVDNRRSPARAPLRADGSVRGISSSIKEAAEYLVRSAVAVSLSLVGHDRLPHFLPKILSQPGEFSIVNFLVLFSGFAHITCV